MMEFRKIIAFGKSSFVVSLPKDWLTENHLVKGDVLFLERDRDNLIIHAKEKNHVREETKVTINVDGKDLARIKREVHSAYINSFNYIQLIGKTLPQYSKDINKFVNNLIALEIIEHDSEKIIAKDYLNLEDMQVKDHVKKLDIIMRSIIKDLGDPKFTDYKELFERGDYATRLYFLILKVCKTTFDDISSLKRINMTPSEMMEVYSMNTFFRGIIRNLKTIITRMSTINKNRREKMLVFIKEMNEFYLNVMKANIHKNVEAAYALDQQRDKIIDNITQKLNSDPDEIVIGQQLIAMSRSLHQILRRTFDSFFK